MIAWMERAKAAISQTGMGGTAKTDDTAVSRLLAFSSVPVRAVAVIPERLSSVLTVPSPAILEKHDSSIALNEDPDRWCCPHSSAMNGAEIDTFAARQYRFTYRGLPRAQADALADKLAVRDREHDDRRVCLECKNLAGYAPASWRCGNWQNAGIATRSSDSQLPADFAVHLQRCDGFIAHSDRGPISESEYAKRS
jgi:hypothetical protein